MCCSCVCFLSKSLPFTLNSSYSTPKPLCSSPNRLIFTLNLLSGYVPMSAVPSGCCGEGLCCSRKARWEKLVGWVDSNGRVSAGVHKTILAQDFNCAKTNPDTNSQYNSWVFKVIDTQVPRSTREYNPVTAIVIRP